MTRCFSGFSRHSVQIDGRSIDPDLVIAGQADVDPSEMELRRRIALAGEVERRDGAPRPIGREEDRDDEWIERRGLGVRRWSGGFLWGWWRFLGGLAANHHLPFDLKRRRIGAQRAVLEAGTARPSARSRRR